MWWNGWVFSFDADKRDDSDGEESSGMNEAELGLGLYASSDSDFDNLRGQEPNTENHGGEEFADEFGNLTLGASANSTKIETNFIVISATGRSFFLMDSHCIFTHIYDTADNLKGIVLSSSPKGNIIILYLLF
jgi:hypothetical protein